MKDQRGITLMSLMIYIIVTILVIATLTTIMSYFSKNLTEIIGQDDSIIEIDKINISLLKEVKKTNNSITAISDDMSTIIFTTGNSYTFKNNGIYLNDNIQIAENIKNCKFGQAQENGKEIAQLIIETKNKTYIKEFVLSNQIENNRGLEETDYTSLRLPLLAGKRVEKNTDYVDNRGKVAIVPAGFTISKIESETSINGGLVIYDIPTKEAGKDEGMTDEEIAKIDWANADEVLKLQKTYSQFVWIPVDDINDMFMCQNKGSTVDKKTYDIETCTIVLDETTKGPVCTKHGNCELMAGCLYEWSSSTGEAILSPTTYTANSGFSEPNITSYDNKTTNLEYLNSILGTTYEVDDNKFKEDLQKEYNEIVKSVKENGGFWVGRYETSGMTATTSSKSNSVKSIAGEIPSVDINWYYMYAEQKQYALNKGLLGGMIQGAAQCQALKFIANGKRPDGVSYTVATAENVGHSFSSKYQTGGSNYITEATELYNDVSQNIYDLEGNVLEWSTGADDAIGRAYRGGCYYASNPASYCDGTLPDYSNYDLRL